MAWYSDEQYEMIKDSREKKSIAASAFKQRSHCGKGGRVKFPSDSMSRKELNAMNGEVKSYRLNDPMSWEEFKSLPDDLKVDYIKALREKFCVPDKYVAEMFGISMGQLGLYLRDLKLEMVHDIDIWNKESFLAWMSGADSELVTENEPKKYERAPMSWTTFKTLSNDEKVEYIQWVRETFGAPEKEIAGLFGINKATFAHMVRVLGCGVGKNAGGSKRNWDRSEFDAWVNQDGSVKIEEDVESTESVESVESTESVDVVEPVETVEEIEEDPIVEMVSEKTDIPAVPVSGSMNFECPAELALDTIKRLLGTANVKLSVSWEVI